MRLRIVRTVLLSLLAATIAAAQTPPGSLGGIVRDSSGAVIAAAGVRLNSASAGASRETVTDRSGQFTVSGLPFGTYEIAVKKAGFRPFQQANIPVGPGGATNLTLQLEVAPAGDAVKVPANSAGVATDDSTSKDLLELEELIDMVQDSREVTDLAYLRSGVSRRASGGLGSGYVVGGARSDNTNFLVDGFSDYDRRTGNAQVMPNYDAIEEFRVQTSGNTAEYGRLAGGVMNIALRTGTNRLHGSMFEYVRSGALAARNFFDAEKSPLLRNQFGATVSGPVTVPGLYRGKDRTFFLLSGEGYRQSLGSTRLTSVPTVLERTGDFSRSLDTSGNLAVVSDPLTGKTFPLNRIPESRIDPIAQSASAYYPLPNRSDSSSNYGTDRTSRARWQSLVLKVDEHPNAADTVSFRLISRGNDTVSPYTGSDLGLFGSRAKSQPTLAGLTYLHVFGPTLINELRTGFARTSSREYSQYGGQDINRELGLPQVTTDPHLTGFPRFTVLNLAALGDAASMPRDIAVNNYEVSDVISANRGRHVLKFGASVLRLQLFQHLYNNARGTFSFLGRWSGGGYSDLLLGMPDSTSRQSSSSPAYLLGTSWGAFVQDTFSVGSWLTLNYGVRYEATRPSYEKYGRISNFVPELGQVVIADAGSIPDLAQRIAAAGLTGKVTTAAEAGLPRALVYPNTHNLAPRLGFAIMPFRNRETVIRGGYGIYFAESLQDPVSNDLTNIYPFTVSQTFNRVSSRPGALTLQDPFPAALASLPGVNNVNGFASHPHPQYLESYTISLEHQIGSGTVLELDYAGSRGVHLGQRYDLNQPVRSAKAQVRPFTAFGTINYYAFGANSIYNEGSMTLRRRIRGGVFYGLAYVYSKSIDDASQISGNSQGDYPGAQNSRDLRAERGRSDWDTRHSFLFFGTCSLPFRDHWLLRRWQLSTTSRLYSGQPFTPRVANANLSLGDASRPNRTARGTLAHPGVDGWFDLAAFPVVSRGTYAFGNSGRNILDGPGSVIVNAALMKNLRLADRVNAQFRCETTNLLNRANFGLPVNYVDAKNAGQLLTSDPGRVVQLGLRLQL